MKNLVIVGAGGFGREVAWLARDLSTRDALTLAAFVEDDAKDGRLLHGVPVLNWQQLLKLPRDTTRVAVAVGDPAARRTLAMRVAEAGFAFQSLIHPAAHCSQSVSFDEGAVVCVGSVLTVDISIGAHVHINLNCTVGHDVQIGDYVTLAPGVHVSGNVHIGDDVYIGTGATIINGSAGEPLLIGNGSIIAAGACVTTHVAARSMYAGVPAKLKKNLG